MGVRVLIHGETNELEADIAAHIECVLRVLLKEREYVLFGIPGGRSVRGILGKLAGADVSWQRIHIFFVDERFVPITSGESNYRVAQETFIETLVSAGTLPSGNVHPFRYNAALADGGVSAYEKEFVRYGNRFDIALYGVGEDGHIASLFPSYKALVETDMLFMRVDGAPKPPPERMSATAALIKKTEIAYGLFFGEAKRTAFELFHDSGVTDEQCPVKLLKKAKKTIVAYNF